MSFESKILKFELEASTLRITEEGETTARYSCTGLGDFGVTMEMLLIWYDEFFPNDLRLLTLEDDVRGWNISYQSNAALSR